MNKNGDHPLPTVQEPLLDLSDSADNGLIISADQAFELLESISEAFYGLDEEWRFIYINRKAEQFFRRKREDLIGRIIWEVFPKTVTSKSYHEMLRAQRERQTVRYETFSDLLHFWVEVEIYPTRTGLSVYFHDISQRKQADEGLSRFAAIVTSSNDAIISNTLDGIITSWNHGAERIFGYTADEIIGKPITILIPPQRQNEEVEFLEKIVADETVKHFDTVRLKKDGSGVFVSVSLAALKDKEGKIVGFTKIAQNITERKQAEAKIQELNEHLEQQVEARTAQLLAVNKNLDSFAYVVSHDLKAPLRGITQLASWLAEDYAQGLDDEGRNMLQLMVGRTKRMHQMIEGILQYSRVGRVKENLTKIDLNSLVVDVIDLLAPPESITITVPTDLPVVQGDEMRIRQVFQNLIGNAIKYMDKPVGKIAVRWADQQTNWQFAIADNGPGIASQYHEKIFQIFQTLSPRDEVESTGIGLSLVHKIIELHKGHVWLDSVEGESTTFYFTLPKMMEENSHEE